MFLDFQCPKCDHAESDVLCQSVSESVSCPVCESKMTRLWTFSIKSKGKPNPFSRTGWNPEMALHPDTGAEYNTKYAEIRSQTSRLDTPGIPNFLDNPPDGKGPGKKVKYFNGIE